MMPPSDHISKRYAIIPYYFVAALAFVFTTVMCIMSVPFFTGHYFQPRLLAITHLAVIGWGITIIFGATNQLIPVITERRLYCERLPVVVLVLQITGLVILIPGFWYFSLSNATYIGAGLILSGIVLHAYNVFRTAKNGSKSVAIDFILIAHVWLITTASIGLLLLVNLRYPFLPEEHLHYLKVHGSVGMAGWFLQLIIGVSSRLIPMFLLSRNEDTKWLNISYYLINITLILFLLDGMILHITPGSALYIVLLPALLCYFVFIRKCYSSAMRKKMDHGMKQTFLALLLVVIPFVLLSCILLKNGNVSPRMVTAYGFSFFFGFISTIIMGQTFKTLPFIVWMHVTKPNQLPELLPKDLFSESLVKWQMIIFLSGYLLMLTGIIANQLALTHVGSSLITFSAILYFFHVCFIISKLVSNGKPNKTT